MFDGLAGEGFVEMRVLVEEVDMSVVEACVAGGRVGSCPVCTYWGEGTSPFRCPNGAEPRPTWCMSVLPGELNLMPPPRGKDILGGLSRPQEQADMETDSSQSPRDG